MHASRRLVAGALLSMLGGAVAAHPAFGQEREYVLRFIPPEAESIDGYRVYVTSAASPATDVQVSEIDAIAPDPDGLARTTLLLDANVSHSIAMTSYNAAGESEPSNELVVAPSACVPTLCHDDDPCTADDCDASGCVHTALPDQAICDDGLPETVGDRCLAGQCVGVESECSIDGDCDDADACNGVETCTSDGLCAAGLFLGCGEPTQCAAPACDSVSGCLMLPVPDGTLCDDGRPKTRGERCSAGICTAVRNGNRKSSRQ